MNEPTKTPPTKVHPPAAALALMACAALVVTEANSLATGFPRSRTARLHRAWARPRRKARRKRVHRGHHHGVRRRARGTSRFRSRGAVASRATKARARSPRHGSTRSRRGDTSPTGTAARSGRPAPTRHRGSRRPSLKQARRRLLSVTGSLPLAWSPEFATVIKPRRPQREPGKPPVSFHGAQTHRARCLALLRKRHVPFRMAGPHYGIAAPLILTGRVGGILYKNKWKPKEPPLMDCLLALTLFRAAPVWRRHGVREVIFSNTYRKGRRGDPRPSRHALGLAMDVRDLKFDDGTVLNVEKDWEKFYGRPRRCVGPVRSDKAARLRAIVCDMEAANVYRRILTPDSDHGHRDHFHMAAAKPGERWGRERWAGRLLYQPLPGTRLFSSWYHWYQCYKHLSWRRRRACWRSRRPHWVRSGNPHRFTPAGHPSYLAQVLGHRSGETRDRRRIAHAAQAAPSVPPSRVTIPAPLDQTGAAPKRHRSDQGAPVTHEADPKRNSATKK